MEPPSLFHLLLLVMASGVRGYVSIELTNLDNSSIHLNNSSAWPYRRNAFYDSSFSPFRGFKLTGYLHLPDSEDYCTDVSVPVLNDSWFVVYEKFPSCLSSIVDNLSTNTSYKLILICGEELTKEDAASIHKYEFPIVIISRDQANCIAQFAVSDLEPPEVVATVYASNNLFVIVVVLLSLAVSAAVCIMGCFCCCLMIRYCNRATYQHLADSTVYAQRPLGARKTRQLPVQEYLERSSEEVCAICREVLRSGDPVKVLPCGHRCFHPECISIWLIRRNNKCPVCRNKVKVKNRHTYSEGYRIIRAKRDDDFENPFLLARENSASEHYGLSVNST